MKKRFIAAVLAAGLTFTGCGATKQTVTDTEVFQDGEVQTQETAQSETQMQEKETQETESPIKIEITSEHHEGTSDESREDVKYTMNMNSLLCLYQEMKKPRMRFRVIWSRILTAFLTVWQVESSE